MLDDETLIDSTAKRNSAAYLWVGTIALVLVASSALLIGRGFGRQMRLARLKNDLAATVSHELKTPLAKIKGTADLLSARTGSEAARTMGSASATLDGS